jgi:hypothetical protein
MSAAHPHESRPLRRALLAVMLAGAVVLACAPAASAEPIGEKIILRCTHGESLAGFTQAGYKQALEELSSDTEEYSPCTPQIRAAEAAAAAHRGGTGTGGASEAPPVALAANPAELSSLAKAKRVGSGGVSVGGDVIHPGVVHADIASALGALPAPLLAVLAMMLASLVVVAAVLVRKRVRGRRPN